MQLNDIRLEVGMKAYASSLSLHVDGAELRYKAPHGKKFAVILMDAEKPDSAVGLACDEWLHSLGWRLEED